MSSNINLAHKTDYNGHILKLIYDLIKMKLFLWFFMITRIVFLLWEKEERKITPTERRDSNSCHQDENKIAFSATT